MILTAIDDHHGFRPIENLQKTYLKKENINIRLNVKIIGSYAFYLNFKVYLFSNVQYCWPFSLMKHVIQTM